VRRQSHARERHEAGASIKDLELGGLLPVIKVNTSHRLRPDLAVQLSEFKGETWDRFGEVMSRGRRLELTVGSSEAIHSLETPDRGHTMAAMPPRTSAGVFFCGDWMDNRSVPLQPRADMTDRRPLLRAIFDAAVAAAHPDVVLSAHLRPRRKAG
jgi:hypothetical protein